MSVNNDIENPERWDKSDLSQMIPNPIFNPENFTKVKILSGQFIKDGNKIVPMTTDEEHFSLELLLKMGLSY